VPQCVLRMLLPMVAVSLLLSGCASSQVTREAASNVDVGMLHTKSMVNSAANTNLADTYQNSSQAAKGAVLGGAAGAVTGYLVSGIGTLPGAAAGMILGASYGSYIDAHTTLKDKLENRGVNIIELGDQILIVIPSARIFDPRTPNVKQQAYSTLALTARYVNQFTKMLVRISVYTDATGASSVDKALSDEQAARVAKVLLDCGIDARILYAEGMGGTRLVTDNTMNWDSDNYRIEITLEKLYV
jgi:outer membrane protein OmpA-like peptidoglycan-associated protein